MRSPRLFCLSAAMLALLASGCTTVRPAPAPIAYTPPAPAPEPAFGGYGNLAVPPRLADGGYATPNRTLSSAGAVWHLRAGLNVAALACAGNDAAALVAGYNALLDNHRAEFATAYRTLGAEYGKFDAFDSAMTRLYNYYALPPAHDGLCRAANVVLNDAAQLSPGTLSDFAPAALARLDAAYIAIFAAQDVWLTARLAARAPIVTATAAILPRALSPQMVVDRTVLSLP